MIHVRYFFLIAAVPVFLCFSAGQEFIKKPKEKSKEKKVSAQQRAERKAQLVQSTNNALAVLVEIQKQALDGVNSFCEGEKDCLTKDQQVQEYMQDGEKIRIINEMARQLPVLHEHGEQPNVSEKPE
jgi:hypothetical protein